MQIGTYTITIDFSKLFVHNTTTINFKEGDLNTARVRAKLTMQGKVIDLSGCSVNLKIETLYGNIITDATNIVDAENGIVEIDFKTNALIKGINFFELIIVKDGSVKKSPKMAYRVLDSIADADDSVEGTNEYPILIQLITDTTKAIENANKALELANTMQTNLEEVIDNANIKINEVDNAKDAALNAADEAKKAIIAGTQDLEVKNARGEYESLNDRLNALDKDLLKSKEIGIIPVVTENNFAVIEETTNGYIEDIKLEGKTLIVNSRNEEISPGTEATLKSVGDDVEEIVVTSVNENLFNEELLQSRLEGDGYYHFRTTGNTVSRLFLGFLDDRNQQVNNMTPNTIVNLSNRDLSNYKFLIGINGNVKDDKIIIPLKNISCNLNTSLFVGCEYIVVDNNHIKVKNIELSPNKDEKSYVKHKSDKKKVLYYDTESQTWKKPTLREWVSIEKHTDGKYYYHKRSNKAVLNGSENFNLYSQSLDDYICFYIDIPNCLPKSDLICDKLKNVPAIYLESFVQEGICVHPTLNRFYIKIHKSKLSSHDVQGFKTWLQTNPISIIYLLVQEEIYECTYIDLIAFENETSYMIECGSVIPKARFRYEGYIGNVINTLKEKVSYLEDKLYKTNLANFTVALNALDTKLKLEQLTKTPR